MKNIYKVEIFTDVYIEDYEHGELDRVNYYENEEEVTTESPIIAIEKALNNLGFSFDVKYSETDEDNNSLYYSNLTDNDNFEVTEKDSLYKEWQEGKRVLYTANHTIKLYQLNEVKLIIE